jgi:hypothetical protein
VRPPLNLYLLRESSQPDHLAITVMTQPHEILEIEPNATPEQIKKAFLGLARTAHPDAGGTKERFIALQDAYESMMQAAVGSSTDSMADLDSADQKPAADQESTAEQESYEAHVREVWEAAQAYRRATVESAEPKQTRAVWQALLVTPLSAAMIAFGFTIDGHVVYPGLWSFMFCVVLLVIVWFCGLAAVVGSSPAKSDALALYNRFVSAIAILIMVILLQSASGQIHPAARPSQVRVRPIALQFAPAWWPMRGARWSLKSLPSVR